MTTVVRSPVFIVGLVLGLALGAGEAIGGGEAWRVVVSAAFPIGWGALVTIVGRRNDTASVLAGKPVDERAALLNQEASSWALGITALVVVAAVAVATATHGDWAPYALMAVVMAVAYVGSLLYLQARR